MKHLDSNSDKAIWAGLKKGNEHALGSIFDKYVYVLYNYGAKITKDHALVEDCIQDVFMELWQRRSNLSDTTSIKYYLFKSLRRRILKKLSQNSKLKLSPLKQEEHNTNFDFSYEEQLLKLQTSKENQDRLKLAFNELSDKQKKVVFLKFYDKLSYEEIAVIMSLNVKAVYDLVYHSMKALKKHFQKVFLLLSFLTTSFISLY